MGQCSAGALGAGSQVPAGGPYATMSLARHRCVNHFCNKMGNQPEEAQVEAALAEMEEALSEAIVEYLKDHIQEKLPESQQESSPVLLEVQQRLCHIFQGPSVSASLEVQNLEESIWDFEDPIDILQGRTHQLVDNFCETLLWTSKDEVCSDLTELEQRRVDYFCDMMGNQPEKAQMEAALAEMEGGLSEDIVEYLDVRIQENLPESSPLLCETQQEFCRRVCEPSGSYSPPSGSYSPPGPNQPFDSSTSRSWYDWILE